VTPLGRGSIFQRWVSPGTALKALGSSRSLAALVALVSAQASREARIWLAHWVLHCLAKPFHAMLWIAPDNLHSLPHSYIYSQMPGHFGKASSSNRLAAMQKAPLWQTVPRSNCLRTTLCMQVVSPSCPTWCRSPPPSPNPRFWNSHYT
jgi:hypothetical protein